MKRHTVIWIFFALFGILLVGKLSNTFVFRQMPSDNFYPNNLFGNWVFTSSFAKIKYNDIVCYKIAPKPHVELARFLANEEDTVELKDGYILRNGVMTDNPETIILSYYTRKEINDLNKFKGLKINPIQIKDTVVFNLSYTEFKLMSRQYLLRLYRSRQYNFPLIIVPKGYCLVGRDNRSVESDNFAQELVPLRNIVGKVL